MSSAAPVTTSDTVAFATNAPSPKVAAARSVSDCCLPSGASPRERKTRAPPAQQPPVAQFVRHGGGQPGRVAAEFSVQPDPRPTVGGLRPKPHRAGRTEPGIGAASRVSHHSNTSPAWARVR